MGEEEKRYAVTYHRLVPGDIKKLDASWQTEVREAIEAKLTVQPEVFGKPLRQSLKNCRTLRVGDYRVIFQITGSTVRIIAIIHRSREYAGIEKRL